MEKPDFLTICSNSDFEALALDRFRFQFDNVKTFRKWCFLLKKTKENVHNVADIPFMPVELFKKHAIIAEGFNAELCFYSSGTTTSNRSTHLIAYKNWYETAFSETFNYFFGKINQYAVFGLLPSYLERSGASLVYMVQHLQQSTKNNLGGFYLNKFKKLTEDIEKAVEKGLTPIVFGVSFALIDWAEYMQYPLPKTTIIIETGGMKGKRKELIRSELHEKIATAFALSFENIRSEYGMTELLSQAYTQEQGFFSTPPWMQIVLRETNDPFTLLDKPNKIGGINIIDLSNKYSCSFLATQDLGKLDGKGRFEVLGRFDDAELRGCNLLLQ